jgi:hypothetical protein
MWCISLRAMFVFVPFCYVKAFLWMSVDSSLLRRDEPDPFLCADQFAPPHPLSFPPPPHHPSTSLSPCANLSLYIGLRPPSGLNNEKFTPPVAQYLNRTVKEQCYFNCTRAVCKVRGLTLLLRVGTLWRCGDGLFFEVPPLISDALFTTLHPILENEVTVVLEEPFLWWRSNLSGASALRDWKVVIDALTEMGGTPSEHPPCSPDLAPCYFWALSTMTMELWGQNRLFHNPPEACGKRSAAGFLTKILYDFLTPLWQRTES